MAYFVIADVKANPIGPDEWIRRNLRAIVWRQWKTPRTRINKLRKFGVYLNCAAKAAWNGRGPWWDAGVSHMNLVLTKKTFGQLGLTNLTEEHHRFAVFM